MRLELNLYSIFINKFSLTFGSVIYLLSFDSAAFKSSYNLVIQALVTQILFSTGFVFLAKLLWVLSVLEYLMNLMGESYSILCICWNLPVAGKAKDRFRKQLLNGKLLCFFSFCESIKRNLAQKIFCHGCSKHCFSVRSKSELYCCLH